MKWQYPWKVTEFERNSRGRDFVAGDIHGEFENLEFALGQLDFNQERDRLFCVGDLVDRGPASHRITEFVAQNWFYSIAGNHEWMLYNCHSDDRLKRELWLPNGGHWWQDTAETEKIQIIDAIESGLSALITVESIAGRVGLVHALPYPYYSWAEFCSKIQSDQVMQNWAIWERDIDAYHDKAVKDVDLIFCGHTPMDKPYSVSNLINIDTGCGHQASPWLAEPALTIVELSESLSFYRFNSGR